MNILVVFKKNFEEVHDEGLMALKAILHNAASDHHQVRFLAQLLACAVPCHQAGNVLDLVQAHHGKQQRL
ncbi:MAG: hypothetical protein ACPG34_08125, partial [Poseidonia sp.]